MTEKSTAWTPEELAEIAARRERGSLPARWKPRPAPHCNGLRCGWERCYCRCDSCEEAMLDWVGHDCPVDEHCSDCVDEAFCDGAAVMGGLLLMAEALHARYFGPSS